MVDFSLEELRAEPVHVNLDTYLKLSPPRRKLSSFFTGDHVVDDECLQIIAKVPGTSRPYDSHLDPPLDLP